MTMSRTCDPSKVLLVVDADHTSAQGGDEIYHFYGHRLELQAEEVLVVPREFVGLHFGRSE
jgi:hypothetical protein